MNDKAKLRELLMRGFEHLSALSTAINRIQKESKDEEEALKHSIALSMVFRALNDVLHPGYVYAQELFPEQDLTAFIDTLNRAQQETIDKKVFPPCKCSGCKNDELVQQQS